MKENSPPARLLFEEFVLCPKPIFDISCLIEGRQPSKDSQMPSKIGFTPISISEYIKRHIKANPGTSRSQLEQALNEALEDFKKGIPCQCGNSIWVIGSALSGHACFSCITGDVIPDAEYEIDEACDQ